MLSEETFIDHYEAYLSLGKSSHTVKAYTRDLSAFTQWWQLYYLYLKQVAQAVITGQDRYRVMSNKHNPKIEPSEVILYQIRLKGHLGQQWADWFEGLTLTLETNGETLLTGPVADQAARHGLLRKVRDLAMPLLSVNRVKLDQLCQRSNSKSKGTGFTKWD